MDQPPDDLVSLTAALAGDYVIEREIGRGGMGIVYRARDVKLDRPVAVKVLPPNLAGVDDVRERFLREARTAARLTHPNIVPVHRADEVGGFVFFIMGLVDGQSLADLLRARGRLSPMETAPLLADVARALSYAHARGIVHRDIKPENVLIDAASGRAMVTDFGIARLAEASPLTATGQVLGTVHFMSPEQVSGDRLDGRSDLYSLGVVGFLALSGRYPFDGATASAVLVSHVTKVAPPLRAVASDVPEPIGRVIDRCLMRDPAARFSDGEALARALDETTIRSATQPIPAGGDVLSEREAMAIWGRAAELQALTSAAPAVRPPDQVEAARSHTRGYRIDHVREAAVEAGISASYVQRAMQELGFGGPTAAGAVAPLQAPVTSPFVRALIGAPTGLHYETTVEGELAEADFEVVLMTIRRVMRDAGHVSMFARTLSWSPTALDRRMNISISSRAGRTTVAIDERLGSLIGGLFGGIGGGLGGGGAGGVAALAQHALGTGWMGPAIAVYLFATYGLARTIYVQSVRRRDGRHRHLLDELTACIRELRTPPPRPAIGAGSTAHGARLPG